MNYKKYILATFLLLTLGQTYASDETKVETFYYVTTLETIGKYVDNENTTLGYLYEYDDFLNEKIAVEYDTSKLGILYKLQYINLENIKKQLISLDTSKNNIDIFIKYFEGKNPEYQKNIDIIKNTGVINSKDENGDTIFKYIIKNGSFSDIDFALNRGLNPNNKDKNGNITFYDFIKTGGKFYPNTFIDKLLAGKFDEVGTIDIIKNVIKKGFDINLLDNKSENIIFAGLDLKNPKIIDLILKNKKLDLNIKNIDGKNPLLYAIEKLHDKSIIISLIGNTGIDINATDNDWNSVFHLLAGKEIEYYTELFKKGININTQNKNGDTILSKIIIDEPDESKIIKKYNLLKNYKPINIDLKDIDGNNSLFKAILLGKFQISKELLKDVKDINTLNNSGQNILLVAGLANGNVDIINEILKLPINVNLQDINGNNALHFALKNMNYDIISSLIKAGVNVNTLNIAGENLLTQAINKNDYKLLNLAIESNADINKIVTKENNSILSLMAKYDKTEMIKLFLKDKKVKAFFENEDTLGNTPLSYAIENKNLELLKIFIHYKANINYKNLFGKTYLMQASEIGDFNILKFLLSIPNIGISDIDTTGKNALLYSCSNPEENTIKTLITKTNDILLKDFSGKSCLDYLKEVKNISLETLELIK